MDHAAAKDFQPIPTRADFQTTVFSRTANIHLRRGLGEGEEGRPEAQRQIGDFEIDAAEFRDAALQVAHMGFLVHNQTFHLMKHGRVGHV